MRPDRWLDRLAGLLERFPEYGIGPDLAALSLAELWGLWRFLNRLSEG